MSNINYLDYNLELEGKRVLLRVDFNVPINNGIITESSRIEKVLPTINFLIENGQSRELLKKEDSKEKKLASQHAI